MLKGLMWSYDDAANAAGYKSGESIRTTVQNKSRELPRGLRMAVLVYERFAFKQMQRNNLISIMHADEDSGMYEDQGQ